MVFNLNKTKRDKRRNAIIEFLHKVVSHLKDVHGRFFMRPKDQDSGGSAV